MMNEMAKVKQEASKLAHIFKAVYDDVLVSKYKDQHFWILTAFIPTFAIARLWVHYFPGTFVQVNGQHIHHFAWGFVLLAVSGYLSITRPKRATPILAMAFGIGLGLAIDEAGMWLHLTNYYYNETSENIIILTTAVLINLVYLRQFWVGLIKEITFWVRSL